MHTNDIAFAARVETETADLDPQQVADMAQLLVAEHDGSALTQTRHAMTEAHADGDAALYALWQAIQVRLLEMGPPFPVYA